MTSDPFIAHLARHEAFSRKYARWADRRGLIGLRDELISCADACSSWRHSLHLDQELAVDNEPDEAHVEATPLQRAS